MRRKMQREARQRIDRNQSNQKIRMISALLSVIVVLGTVAGLTLPAETLSRNSGIPVCQHAVHRHTEECYDRENHLVCGYANYVVHKHDANCYQDGKFICTLPEVEEHKHSDACYRNESVLTCTLPESETHHHTDECYEMTRVLVCGNQELHTHTEDCFDKNGKLVCGLTQIERHQHTKDCLKVVDKNEQAPEQDANTAAQLPALAAQPEQNAAAQSPALAAQHEQGSTRESASPAAADGTLTAETEKPEAAVNATMPAQQFSENAEGITVHAEAPEGALPAGTTMSVTRVTEKKIINTVTNTVDGAVKAVEAVDITFRNAEGQEIEPSKEIRVAMSSAAIAEAKAEESVVVHVDDHGKAEVVDQVQNQSAADQVVFDADAFSVYAVAFTVDFEYEIDGKTFAYSIEGGSSISLKQLLPTLGIVSEEAADQFVTEQIKNVTFSNPALVKVVHKTPVLGLVGDEDWVLESLQPFDTEEKLTITLADGNVIVVKVTDKKESSREDGTFEVIINPGRNQTVTYWDTFVEAVQAVNSATGTAAAVINVLDLKDNGSYTIDEPVEIKRNSLVTINGDNHVLLRGSGVQGDLIKKTQNALTVNELVLDNNNVQATGALLANAGTGKLTVTKTRFNGSTGTGGLINIGSNGAVSFSDSIFNGNNMEGHLIYCSSNAEMVFSGCELNGSTTGNHSNSLIYRTISTNLSGAGTKLTNVTIKGGSTSGDIISFNVTGTTARTIPVTLSGCTISLDSCTGSVINMATWASASSKVNILANTTITGPTISSQADLIKVKPATSVAIPVSVENTTVYRGSTTGSVLSNQSTGTTSITNSTISGAKSATDSSSVSATAPLVRQGTGALTLTGAKVEDHTAAGSGICAVEASSASAVTISGATNITGNTSGGKAANLHIPDDATKTKIGALSKDVGITTAKKAAGANFANLSAYTETSGISHLSNDANDSLTAVRGSATNDTKLYWFQSNMKPTSKFYIKGNLSFANDVTIYYDTLEEAVAAASDFNGAVTIYSMVEEYTMYDPIKISKDITIRPGKSESGGTVSRLTIKRGSETGILILHTKGAFTLKDVTLDGEEKDVTGSLIKSTGGAGNLTLDNTTVRKHTATTADTYAVDATDNNAKIRLLGNTNINGNTANEKPSNLGVIGEKKLTVAGNLNGNIGVSNVLYALPGQQFGVKESSGYSIGTITNDYNSSIAVEVKNNTELHWKGNTSSTGPVVKITDKDGKLLKTAATGSSYAVYNTFHEIAAAINGGKLYTASGTLYTGAVNVELLRDYVETGKDSTAAQNAAGIKITAKRDITFKTASKNPPDNRYPYTGTAEKGMLRFMNGGPGNNTDKRFIFQGEGTKITFENIIIDGRADQGIQADQGGLILVGDRGSERTHVHNVTLILGSGAVLQNGASNTNDQGGGLYVGPGCTLKMHKGSIIQYCKSNDGNDSSGGAIFLGNSQHGHSEFYCDGGIIRNCVSSHGGAIDVGGAADSVDSTAGRVYFAGSPQIIDNYNNNGDPLNVHLNYDTNLIINSETGGLDSDAHIGIYVDDDRTARSGLGLQKTWTDHGHETQPFGTIKGSAKNLSAFRNDRDTRLTGAQSTTNDKLIVWFYEMNASAVDDYYIDGELIRTTEIDNSEGVYRPNPDVFPTNYTDEQFDEAYHTYKGYALNKKSEYDRIVLEEYNGNNKVDSGVQQIRYVKHGDGRRWEYTTNGTTWQPFNGRDLTFHYKRENRDNINFVKVEDTNGSDKLEGAKFKLERSYPGAKAYSLYTKGAGKGKTKAGDTEVKDASVNGIYTSGTDGSFIMNLPEGYYRLTETEAPEGYLTGSPITFKVGVTAVPDTPENEEVSPYSVESVSSNGKWTLNDYETWNTEKYIGNLTVGNTRKIPLHVLIQKSPGVYEQKDDMRTTEYITAGITEGEKTVGTSLNPAAAGYTDLHIYYGKPGDNGTFDLDTSVDVSKLKGTEDGIIVNDDTSKVLTKDKAVYFVWYPEPRTVPVHIVEAKKGNDGKVTYVNHDSDWRKTDSLTVTATQNATPPGTAGDNGTVNTTYLKNSDKGDYTLAFICRADPSNNLTDLSAENTAANLRNFPDGVKYGVDAAGNGGTLLGTQEIYYVYYKKTTTLPVIYMREDNGALTRIPDNELDLRTGGNARSTVELETTSNAAQSGWLGNPANSLKDPDTSELLQNEDYFYAAGPSETPAANVSNLYNPATVPESDHGDVYFSNRYDGIYTSDTQTGTYTNRDYDVAVYVIYRQSEVEFTLSKVDSKDSSIKLEGAQFKLLRANSASDTPTVYDKDTDHPDGLYMTDSNGEITFALKNGYYELVEMHSPAGYIILEKKTSFTISRGEITLTDGQSGWATLSVTGTGKNAVRTLQITNPKGQELPSTGGTGTLPYTLSGLALSFSALMYGFKLRRGRERRSDS